MGVPKGLLPVAGGTRPILEVLVQEGRRAAFDLVLVGDDTPYAGLARGVPRIDDDPPGAGPLAGLRAALHYAVTQQNPTVVTVACDMPYVTAGVLRQLCEHSSSAPALAAHREREGIWEPMLARYDAARVVEVVDEVMSHGHRSFQRLFEEVEAEAWPVSPVIARALRDWDTPQDIPR